MIYVALFRGINVGGKNPLPMKELVALLEGLGLSAVKSYVQSGNVVFAGAQEDRSAVMTEIARAVEARFGFSPKLVLLTLEEIERVVLENPFPQGDENPKELHVGFLRGQPDRAKLYKLAGVAGATERWHLTAQALYFWAPEGFGRSKFPASAERLLGVIATFRNWRTVVTMRDLAREVATIMTTGT
jgi:uncharacterized protein (DUF1697 family)